MCARPWSRSVGVLPSGSLWLCRHRVQPFDCPRVVLVPSQRLAVALADEVVELMVLLVYSVLAVPDLVVEYLRSGYHWRSSAR